MKDLEKTENVKNAEPTKVITFERNGMIVKVNGIVCPIRKQATKGEDKEVVNFDKVVGSEWKANRQLSLIPEGISELTIGLRQKTGGSKKQTKCLYIIEKVATKEQQEKLAELKKQIAEIESQIVEVKTPNAHLSIQEVHELCKTEKVDINSFMDDLKKYLSNK